MENYARIRKLKELTKEISSLFNYKIKKARRNTLFFYLLSLENDDEDLFHQYRYKKDKLNLLVDQFAYLNKERKKFRIKNIIKQFKFEY